MSQQQSGTQPGIQQQIPQQGSPEEIAQNPLNREPKPPFPHMPPASVIINTASIQAFKPSPSIIAYASTTGAIVTFTKALAQDAIQKGIRVNAVAPGPVWAPLIVSSSQEKSGPIEFGKESAIGRAAQPAELAPAYVFLALPEASYVNGEAVGVTGGEPPLQR